MANDAAVVFNARTLSTYSHAGTDWIGYDGPQSTEKKVEFARAQGLGGYFFWALGYNKNWTLSKIGRLFMSTRLFIRRKFHNFYFL